MGTIAALTLLSWGVHLVARGQDPMTSAVASAFGLLMLVPATLVVAGWLGTLHRGAIRPDTPLLFALGFILLAAIGGLDITDIDGVRVKSADGWWLVRASNTQNVLVARAEASDEAKLEGLKDQIKDQLKQSGIEAPAGF